MDVTNKINIYENNGNKINTYGPDDKEMEISNHWSEEKWIVIKIKDKSWTILAKDLINAANNTINR